MPAVGSCQEEPFPIIKKKVSFLYINQILAYFCVTLAHTLDSFLLSSLEIWLCQQLSSHILFHFHPQLYPCLYHSLYCTFQIFKLMHLFYLLTLEFYITSSSLWLSHYTFTLNLSSDIFYKNIQSFFSNFSALSAITTRSFTNTRACQCGLVIMGLAAEWRGQKVILNFALAWILVRLLFSLSPLLSAIKLLSSKFTQSPKYWLEFRFCLKSQAYDLDVS